VGTNVPMPNLHVHLPAANSASVFGGTSHFFLQAIIPIVKLIIAIIIFILHKKYFV
jgi:hypothetical protein